MVATSRIPAKRQKSHSWLGSRVRSLRAPTHEVPSDTRIPQDLQTNILTILPSRLTCSPIVNLSAGPLLISPWTPSLVACRSPTSSKPSPPLPPQQNNAPNSLSKTANMMRTYFPLFSRRFKGFVLTFLHPPVPPSNTANMIDETDRHHHERPG